MDALNILKRVFKPKKIVLPSIENKDTPWSREDKLGKYISCEVSWDKKNPDDLNLKRINRINKKEDNGNLFYFSRYPKPDKNFYTPPILTNVFWKDIIKNLNLESFLIEFSNYNKDYKIYSVIIKATKLNGREVVDSFSSTLREPIDSLELTNNIKSFLDFVEKLKR